MSTYKISVLQRSLDESVPAAELEAANKQYNELTEKYRDIIQRENNLVARSAAVDSLEVRFSFLKLFPVPSQVLFESMIVLVRGYRVALAPTRHPSA